MKKQLFSFFLLLLFVTGVSAQDKETQKIVEFGRIQCGYFMALMDGVFTELQNSSDSKIYVIYYGARYRRNSVWKKSVKDTVTILDYPHHDDGLNWAKTIPLYLSSESERAFKNRDLFKDRIVLLDGGFRENTEVEIWLVPKDAELPKPTPTIDEKDIKFRNDKPRKTPDYTCCYCGYEVLK